MIYIIRNNTKEVRDNLKKLGYTPIFPDDDQWDEVFDCIVVDDDVYYGVSGEQADILKKDGGAYDCGESLDFLLTLQEVKKSMVDPDIFKTLENFVRSNDSGVSFLLPILEMYKETF